MVNAAFENAGQQPGLEIWRIEDFEPVPYPKKDYGKFYIGDSYIVLSTKDKHGRYDWDLHFWLGSETSQDESGTAAILTVQLDDHLDGSPVQYREVQDHESQLFLSHFKNGLRYAPGGVASGFQHVDTTVEKRLFQVKGKRNIRVREVPVDISSLNNGDCFILDAGDDIFVYVGLKSKYVERIKAISSANLIRDQDHGGRPKVQVIDEFSSSGEVNGFFEALGSGSRDDVADESTSEDDDIFEHDEEQSITLHKVSDEDGQINVTEVASKPLQQDMLDGNDCFIVCTPTALYVWIGRHCSPKEKSEAMARAQHFLSTAGLPKHTRIQRIVEGAEPAAFRQCFASWTEQGDDTSIRATYHCHLLPNGRLVTRELHDIGQDDLEHDDVMIVATDTILYVWIGKDSSSDEKDKSVEKAESLKSRGNYANIVTIEQGEEPEEFTKLFSDWNPDFWNAVPSYEDRKHAMLA